MPLGLSVGPFEEGGMFRRRRKITITKGHTADRTVSCVAGSAVCENVNLRAFYVMFGTDFARAKF